MAVLKQAVSLIASNSMLRVLASWNKEALITVDKTRHFVEEQEGYNFIDRETACSEEFSPRFSAQNIDNNIAQVLVISS